MHLNLSDIIKRLRDLEKEFNNTNDPTDRYAILKAIRHIGENELVFIYWEGSYRDAMLKKLGCNIKKKEEKDE